MTSIDRTDSLQVLLAEVLNVPAGVLTERSSPETIESWDSLANMRLMVVLEEAFGVTFSAEEVGMFTSVRATRMLLRGKGVAV